MISGTVNSCGMLHIRALRVGKDTALAQIVKLVENAQVRVPGQQGCSLCPCILHGCCSQRTTWVRNRLMVLLPASASPSFSPCPFSCHCPHPDVQGTHPGLR